MKKNLKPSCLYGCGFAFSDDEKKKYSLGRAWPSGGGLYGLLEISNPAQVRGQPEEADKKDKKMTDMESEGTRKNRILI